MKVLPSASLLAAVLLLTGCMYPQEERSRNHGPNQEQLDRVQSAVDQFHENRGVLPIATRDADTPIFQRYPIEFSQIVPSYMSEPPGNAFENGGDYLYVLTHVEEEPQAGLIDLGTTSTIQELERNIHDYRAQHDYAPVDEIVGNELLLLDFDALGYEEPPTVASPFHPDHRLPLLYTTQGDVIIDYSLDIEYYVEEYGADSIDDEDLRWLLVEHAPFVPAYSMPQKQSGGDIVFFDEESGEEISQAAE
ncbi:hypothetical protein [Alkalicoccus chagannorensis]|uniref:hypothetical protein n=1 Tax=Alkalicoccus chagannorensis TaxID=427072 RepID=UPI0003FFE0D8|nr:hypothetical protein [Alkalicoccus chagannorensis]